jgi:hypothetical protein
LSILFIFSKNNVFVLLILCMLFFGLYFVDFGLYFYYLSPFACFGFSLFCFSRLRGSIRSFI